MSAPLVGASPEQQLAALHQAVIGSVAKALAQQFGPGSEERARTIARAFYNDVRITGAGPALILEQKASPLDLVPQVIVLPGSSIQRFLSEFTIAQCDAELHQLGFRAAR